MRRFLVILVSACCCGSAASAPKGEEAFTNFVAARVHAALPDYDVVRTDSLTLEGKRPDGDTTGKLSLDRLMLFCVRNEAQCDAAVDRYSSQVAGVVRERHRR